MSTYRYNRPITAFLVLTFVAWAPFVAGAHGLKDAWADRAFIARELKAALDWSFEPVVSAWSRLKAYAADKVETIKLRALIAKDALASFWRRQLRERLIALGVLLLAPIAFMGAFQLAACTAITNRNCDSFRSLFREARWFGQDFVRCMATGQAE